jgi:hypothetical protein
MLHPCASLLKGHKARLNQADKACNWYMRGTVLITKPHNLVAGDRGRSGPLLITESTSQLE